MKQILIITIAAFCCISYTYQGSFEGVITYKVDVVFTNKDLPYREYFEQKFGDSLEVFYSKKGDILRKFHNAGERGYDFNLYLNSNNNYYSKWKNLDTIYYYQANDPFIKLISIDTGNQDQILGYTCNSIVVKGIDTIGQQKVIQTYYYSGEPYLDPELFQNYKDFYAYDIFKRTESPFLKLELDLDGYIVTYTAIKIEHKSLNKKQFDLPIDFAFKEY